MSLYSDASSDFDYENNGRRDWWKSAISVNESTRSIDSEVFSVFNYFKKVNWKFQESYESLFKRSELLEQFTNLSFDSNWMFTAAFANIILFVIFTYKVRLFIQLLCTHGPTYTTWAGVYSGLTLRRPGGYSQLLQIYHHEKCCPRAFQVTLRHWSFIYLPISRRLITNFQVVFNDTLFSHFIIKGIIILCDVIVMLDIAASVAHISWKRYANLRDLAPRHKGKNFNNILGNI